MKPNRREFFHTIGAGVAGVGIAPSVLSASSSTARPEAAGDEQILFIGDDIAVTDTVYGEVKGYVLRDIYYFLGIPY